VALEVKVQLEDASVESSLETMTLRHFPLFVDDRESDVFVRNPSAETNRQGVVCTVGLQVELGCLRLVSQLRVENVEFVPLNNLWRRILRVKVRLIVLIPFVTLFDTVEESWLPHHEKLFLTLNKDFFIGAFGIFSVDHIGEFLLIGIHALLLGVLEHLNRGVIESIVVYDVESDAGVQCCLLNLFSKAQLDESLLCAA